MENQKNQIRNIALLLIISFIIGFSISANAETYEYKTGLKIEASNYKSAAKQCFKELTNNKYPGEETGLDIIDVCANPIKGDIK